MGRTKGTYVFISGLGFLLIDGFLWDFDLLGGSFGWGGVGISVNAVRLCVWLRLRIAFAITILGYVWSPSQHIYARVDRKSVV